MKMGELEIGSLVKFVIADTSVDVILPTGTKSTRLWDRLLQARHLVCEPAADDMGVIVAGPELARGGHVQMWQVLVKGDVWWFTEDSLLLIGN